MTTIYVPENIIDACKSTENSQIAQTIGNNLESLEITFQVSDQPCAWSENEAAVSIVQSINSLLSNREPAVSYADQIPAGVAQAQAWLNYVRHMNYKLDQMEEDTFMATWCAVVYLNPALHPDDCDQWPADIQAVAIEAFRRRNIGELTDDELYPSEAIHARLKKEV